MIEHLKHVQDGALKDAALVVVNALVVADEVAFECYGCSGCF